MRKAPGLAEKHDKPLAHVNRKMYGQGDVPLPYAGLEAVMERGDTQRGHRQGDPFDAEFAAACRPDPDRVRRRIHSILAELRGEISARHWERGRASFFRMAFPRLTCWLPEDEAARLDSEFRAEMARLHAA